MDHHKTKNKTKTKPNKKNTNKTKTSNPLFRRLPANKREMKKKQNPNKTNGTTALSTLGEWVSGPATQPAQPLQCQW